MGKFYWLVGVIVTVAVAAAAAAAVAVAAAVAGIFTDDKAWNYASVMLNVGIW